MMPDPLPPQPSYFPPLLVFAPSVQVTHHLIECDDCAHAALFIAEFGERCLSHHDQFLGSEGGLRYVLKFPTPFLMHLSAFSQAPSGSIATYPLDVHNTKRTEYEFPPSTQEYNSLRTCAILSANVKVGPALHLFSKVFHIAPAIICSPLHFYQIIACHTVAKTSRTL